MPGHYGGKMGGKMGGKKKSKPKKKRKPRKKKKGPDNSGPFFVATGPYAPPQIGGLVIFYCRVQL
jgi:hypothetical protein